ALGPAGQALLALLPRQRARRGHGPVGAAASLPRSRALPRGGGDRAALRGRRGRLRPRHPKPLLRPAARGQGNGGDGGPHDGRSAAREGRLRVDAEPRLAPRGPPRARHHQDGGGGRMTTKPLVELAKTIRSKNAGVDQMTLLEFLLLLVIAGICGSVGQAIGGSSRGGCLVSIALGFIGALIGTWLARTLHLPELFTVTISGKSFPIIWSIIGSALFVAVISLISRSRP